MEVVKGIVLKKINYKEHSKIIYLYTETGLKSVLVHGSNKISSPYLKFSEILTLVTLEASGKSLLVLRDGDIIHDYREIKKDIVKYTYMTHVLELIYYFANHEHDHIKLFNFLLKIIDKVNEESDYIPYIYMLELKLLYLLGVNPELKQCVECGVKDNLRFSVKAGGMSCLEHFDGKSEYDQNTINALKLLYYFDLQEPQKIEIDNTTMKNLRALIDEYYEYHLGYRSNSRKILIGLIGY